MSLMALSRPHGQRASAVLGERWTPPFDYADIGQTRDRLYGLVPPDRGVLIFTITNALPEVCAGQ
jgi:hypothetical protein